MNSNKLNRRTFLTGATALSALALAKPNLLNGQTASSKSRYQYCAFEKPLQHLSHDELADFIAEIGFDGIEATVRPGGRVVPEKVEDELPRLVEALKKKGLAITVMTTQIGSVDSPNAEKILSEAARLGIRQYRLNWYRYDLKKPILPQLSELRPKLKDLAAMNRELGLTGVYQNHSGAAFVGAPLWDIYEVLKDINPREIALAYDIRHATVEGGLSWPIQWNLVQPIIGALFMKDFVWEKNRIKSVPLGDGAVDRKFFSMVKASTFSGPVSLHIEYFGNNSDVKMLRDAFKKDFNTLKSLLA